MTETFPIDLDSEKVSLDGAWYGREDLARTIREMVGSGNFHVSRQSAALEALEQTLASLVGLNLKLPAGTFAALSGAASRSNRTVEALARELIERSIAAPPTQGTVASPPVAVQPPAAPLPLTPGKAAEPEAPIALTPKKPAQVAAAGDAESSWFKRR